MAWQYDPGESWQNKKHGWNRTYAGVKDVPVLGRVACCPNGVSRERAAELLNDGLPFFDEFAEHHAAPDRIFAVDEGVPYEARPTQRGVSYHGFPILPEKLPKLPESVRDWLREKGMDDGWLKRWKR